jgi:hypothetical protein
MKGFAFGILLAIEGFLYNVPDEKFGKTYEYTIAESITWLAETDRSKLICANETCNLVRSAEYNSWPIANCEEFLGKVVTLYQGPHLFF